MKLKDKCSVCGSRALIMFSSVECVGATCKNYSSKLYSEIYDANPGFKIEPMPNHIKSVLVGPTITVQYTPPTQSPPSSVPLYKAGDRVSCTYSYGQHSSKLGEIVSDYMMPSGQCYNVKFDDGTTCGYNEAFLVLAPATPQPSQPLPPPPSLTNKFSVFEHVMVSQNVPNNLYRGKVGKVIRYTNGKSGYIYLVDLGPSFRTGGVFVDESDLEPAPVVPYKFKIGDKVKVTYPNHSTTGAIGVIAGGGLYGGWYVEVNGKKYHFTDKSLVLVP